MSEANCEKCGSTRVESAVLEGAALRLERSPTLKKVFSVGMQVSCLACLECGALTRLRVDPTAMARAIE